ncbi:hypothetical protein [Nakamurella deserti]|uniref:hypothetical protein n=1 Tax=Nakamurella deserti TaxID=2164074 RepID=UPI000DBE32C4|nr:hypothetical protein [Nakamurella deserti]
MTTRQAVWPPELIERRRAAARLEARIREVGRSVATGPGDELRRLRAERAALPCPHWEVGRADDGADDWVCADCHDRIVPAWVPLEDQENQLRRAGNRLSRWPAAG